MIDRRPAVIARCTGADDVATAFDFARTLELEVAVRGGGHNPAGHCLCDDGLVIDLTQMRAVAVNGEARTAGTEGGATWLDFDTATQAFGLVAPGGVVVSTGVCGLTLGGGIGHLTAQYGLTCDHLVGAEMVTPEGSLVRATEDENAELLWALRGAGGNFGVATRMEFRLHALDRVVGGVLVYRGDGVRDALRRFRDVVARSPSDLSCQAALAVGRVGYPDPRGRPLLHGRGRGSRGAAGAALGAGVDRGQRRRAPLPRPAATLDSPYGENRHYWKGHFVRELPDELIDELVGAASRSADRPARS